MKPKSRAVLHTLLNYYHPNDKKKLLECVEQNEAKSILEENYPAGVKETIVLSRLHLFKNVHYSWLKSVIESYPKELQTILLACLPELPRTKLKRILKITSLEKNIPESLKNFLLNEMYTKVDSSDVLPLECLPPNEFSVIATWRKDQIIELIDFLGLFDLSEEIRRIIDKAFLKKLYDCLNQKQKNFLRICLHQKEKISSSKLGLEQWDGDCDKLGEILHLRGIVRLGKALSGQHPDFFWHISHALDKGRGELLLKQYSTEPTAKVTEALSQQLIELIDFLHGTVKSE